MRKLYLTLDRFDEAVGLLANELAGMEFTGVYGVPRGGVPRGGVPLAVALSHRLGLPLLMEPENGMLVVDDIRDSGVPIGAFRNAYPGTLAAVWVTRQKRPEGDISAVTNIGDALVVFSWEDPSRADEDRLAYLGTQ
jgi:hypoxanthine phosphoribosyltransferase